MDIIKIEKDVVDGQFVVLENIAKLYTKNVFGKDALLKLQKKNQCRFRMKNDHHKQKFCCKFTRRCCGNKCNDYNSKCKWTGKIITTKHNWKCSMVKVGKGAQKKDVVDK